MLIIYLQLMKRWTFLQNDYLFLFLSSHVYCVVLVLWTTTSLELNDVHLKKSVNAFLQWVVFDMRTFLFQGRENSQSQLFVMCFWSWHCLQRKIFELAICISFPYDVLISRKQNCFGARIIKNEHISLLKNFKNES